MFRTFVIALFLLMPVAVQAVEYHCKVQKKFDSERAYTPVEIEKGQYSVQIEEKGNTVFVSRCSFATRAQKVTCDRYQMDKVVQDNNVKIKKYYLFGSQFDVQVFPSLFFVENNGRGGIAFGKCNVVAP